MRTQTSQKAELLARAFRIVMLGVFAVFACTFLATVVSLFRPAHTSAATSSTINFQARLETNGGAITPDGNYDVTFHIFSASSAVGGTSTDTGCGTDTSCEWAEQYTYNSGPGSSDVRIHVANGYLTVNLGSITAFSGINWNQQQWLTMDIGGTTGSGAITWDGQMSPRLLLTATPYAFQAGQLGATASGFTSTLSLAAPTTTNDTITVPDPQGSATVCFQSSASCGFVLGSGTAFIQGGNSFSGTTAGELGTNNNGVLNFRTNNTDKLQLDTSGNLIFQQASTLNVVSAATGTNLTIQGGAATSGTNVGGNLILQGGAGASTGASGSVIVKSNTNNSTTAFQVQNASAQTVLGVDTSAGKVNLGASSALNGSLVFNNATNANAITLTTGAAASSYSLTLPTATPAAGLCLQTSTASASQLVFASCANTNASITEVQEWDTSGSATLNDSPVNLGDVIIMSTQIPNGGVTVSSVSGGGVTTWTKINANNGNGTVNRVEQWMGVVTTTGAGTITVTYSGAPGTEEVTATEFTAAGVTANTTWGVDTSGSQLNSTGSTTVTYPSLVSEGSAEVYIGYAQVQHGPGIAGSSGGFSYIVTTTQNNVIAYATPTVANTTYQPTASQTSSGQSNTIGAILTAFINSTAINNSTSLQKANFYVQAASSGTVAGVLQANAGGTADILDLKNSSGANVMSIGNTGNALFEASTNATNAFQVQNSSAVNLFAVDTSNNAIVLGNDGTPNGLTVRGGIASGTNVAGANLTFNASNGTGTGGSGAIIFQTAASSISTPTDDGNDNTSNAATTNTLTFSHIVTNNSNRILVVGIGTGCGFGSSCAATVSTVTYAGVSLTRANLDDCTTGQGHCHIELWYLTNPTIGTNNVVITTSGSTNIDAGASSYYNVDPTTPLGTSAIAASNNNPSTLSVSSNTTQLVVDVIASDNVVNSVSGGQTQRYLSTSPALGSSTKPGAASTTSMGWSDGSSNYATIGVGLNPPAGSSSDSMQDRLHITASGNVGINNSSPQYALDVVGTGNFSTSIQAPLLDTSSAVALSLGTTNATQINLNQNTVIATGKTLQVKGHSSFGSNATPATYTTLSIDDTINPASNNSYGISDILRLSPTASDSAYHAGIYGEAQTTSGNTQNLTGGIRGVTFFAQHNGTGTVNQAWGANFYVQNTAAGIISDAEGLDIASASNSGGGSITTNYGIKINDQTVGGTNYSLYTGAGAVYFGDNTTIATGKTLTANTLQSAAATALTITGNAASTWSTSAGNLTIQGGSGTVSLGTSTVLTSTGALSVTGGSTLTLNSTTTSAITLDSGTTGQVNVGTGGNSKTIQIGATNSAITDTIGIGNNTNASGISTITVGSTSSTSATTIQGGTNGVNVGTGGIANTVQIGNTTGAVTQAIKIGTNATASSTNNVTIGSTVAGTTILQAAGIAETITGSSDAIKTSTNSSVAFQIQNANSTPLFGVDTTMPVNNLLTNPGFEVNTTGWAASGTGASITRNVTVANTYDGIGSLSVTLGSGTGTGAAITSAGYAGASIAAGTYTFGFYAMGSAALSGLSVSGFNGGTCTLNQTAVPTSGFQHYFCTITTTGATTSNITITVTTASQTMYIDSAQLVNASTLSAFGYGTLQFRGIVTTPFALQNTSNSTTAFQIQNASSANLFTVDTTNTAIVLGNDGAPSPLTLRGGATTGSNAAGANLTLDASNGTGTGGSGALIFRTAQATSGGGTPVLDSNSAAQHGSGLSTLQWNHTVTGSQANRILIVTVSYAASNQSSTNVTYNGVSMTQVSSQTCPSACADEMWYMLNPPSGTHQVSIVGVTNGPAAIVAGSSSYYNVDQTTPLGTVSKSSGTTAGTGQTITVSPTTTTSELVVDAFAAGGAGGYTIGGSQTQLYEDNTIQAGASSNRAGAAGTTAMSWTLSANGDKWAEMAIGINAPTNTNGDVLTDRLHINANGNVGISNSNPQYTLDVAGSARIQSATNSTTALQVQNSSGANLLAVDTTNTAIVLGNDGTPSPLTVRGGAATGTDIQGSNITLAASNGTGAGGSGDIIFQTAGSGSGGAVTAGTASAAQQNAATASLTFSYTVGSQTNRLLLVSFSTYAIGAVATTGVKFNGTNMTKLSSVANGGGQAYSEVWYMIAPTATTANVVITLTGSSSIVAGAEYFYNVNQTTPLGTAVTATGNSVIATNPLTSTNSNQVVFDNFAFPANVGSWSTTAQTQLWTGSTTDGGASSYVTANNGSTTVTWKNSSTGEQWADVAVPINPISTGSTADTLTDRLHIAANGNIGIGTSTPQDTLSIATGNIYLGSGGGNRINMSGSPTSSTVYNFYGSSTESILNAPTSSGDIAFKIQNTEIARFASNGDLGLNGDTTPGATLDLSATGTIQGAGLSSDCSGTYSRLLWSSSTKQFSCGTTRASYELNITSNQTFSTTSVANATNMDIPMAANDTWIFYMNVAVHQSTGTDDYKFNITSPTGSTCNVSTMANNQSTISSDGKDSCNGTGVEWGNSTQSAGDDFIMTGTVANGSTPGNIQLQIANFTSGGTVTLFGPPSFVIGYKVSGADYAEIYYTNDQSIQAGDVVAINPNESASIEKTNKAYQQSAIGVISTQPGSIIGAADGTGIPQPVALNGRVPIKVSTINGPIEPGDYLTPSNIPGVAMKATRPGQVIAKALTGYTNTDPNAIGMTIGFVDNTWADPGQDDVTANQVQGSDSAAVSTLSDKINSLQGQINQISSQVAYLNKQDIFSGTSTDQFTVQDSSGNELFTADTKDMVVKIANLVVGGTLTVGGHIITDGDTPLTVTLPAAGVDANGANDSSCNVAGNDTSGAITLTTGSDGLTTGAQCLVTFVNSFQDTPRPVLSPTTQDSASVGVYVISSPKDMTVLFSQVPESKHVYAFNYWNVQ